MNVFDVHVNRTPAVGAVARRGYHPGKFLNASFDKASDENERQSFKIRTPSGARSGWSRSPAGGAADPRLRRRGGVWPPASASA